MLRLHARRTRWTRRATGSAALALAVAAVLPPAVLPAVARAQSVLSRSPNLGSDWSAAGRHSAFILSHRFEFMRGGDELLNIPTLTIGVPLPFRLAAGIDYTSNSEITAARLGRNEAQLWLAGDVVRGARGGVSATAARNTAAGSFDGALTGDVNAGPLTLLAAGRWFSDVFATGQAGGGLTGGVAARVTPMLSVSGDYGRLLRPDSVDGVWSAGVALIIPGSRHSVSIHASNGGATTLQGTLRPRVLGTESVRYGFTFTAPLGSRAGWSRVFRGGPPATALAGAGASATAAGDSAAVVIMADLEFSVKELRVSVGDSVTWINRDEVVHTVTADDDGGWGSGLIAVGGSFTHRFTAAGRYPYHCLPHPHMRAVVIVE